MRVVPRQAKTPRLHSAEEGIIRMSMTTLSGSRRFIDRGCRCCEFFILPALVSDHCALSPSQRRPSTASHIPASTTPLHNYINSLLIITLTVTNTTLSAVLSISPSLPSALVFSPPTTFHRPKLSLPLGPTSTTSQRSRARSSLEGLKNSTSSTALWARNLLTLQSRCNNCGC